MEALQGLGDWLTLSQQTRARPQERQRLSTASLGREISDVPLPSAGRRRSAGGTPLGEPNAGAWGEDVVTLASNVQEGRLVQLTQAYERSIQEHVQRGIVNAHERFIGRIGRVVKVNSASASCDGSCPPRALTPCRRPARFACAYLARTLLMLLAHLYGLQSSSTGTAAAPFLSARSCSSLRMPRRPLFPSLTFCTRNPQGCGHCSPDTRTRLCPPPTPKQFFFPRRPRASLWMLTMMTQVLRQSCGDPRW